jgi:hypothetical protein
LAHPFVGICPTRRPGLANDTMLALFLTDPK